MSTATDDFLAHYGIKGMKWGVIRSDPSGGKKAGSSVDGEFSDERVAKALSDFYKTKSSEQLNAEAQVKLRAQADRVHAHKPESDKSSDTDAFQEKLVPGGYTRNQKIAIGVGAAVTVGLLGYTAHKTVFARQGTARALESEWSGLFGTKADVSRERAGEFHGSSFGGLKNGKALDRPGFTIPKSTTFQRLSGHAESGADYSSGTYATFLSNDKRVYGRSEEFGTKKYTLQFKATEDIRVPSTKTVLDTLRKNMTESNNGVVPRDQDVMFSYHSMSGGEWKSSNSQRLIESLKKQGYSAIVDDMDAGYLGDLPVLFFGETRSVKAKKRSMLDYAMDYNAALPLLQTYA